MTMSTIFPVEFADLEPFARWAQPVEGDRFAMRLAATMDELQAFYDVAFPRIDAVCAYIDQHDINYLPEACKPLMWLYFSLVTVTFPVEAWRQPNVPDSGPAQFDCYLEPVL